jgi:hypothetical protein
MTRLLDAADPVMEAHRRAGQVLADSAFREFGTAAEERHLFGIESLMHARSDQFMTDLGATDLQKLHAKIIIGHALRARYGEICRSAPAVAALKESANGR